MAVAGFPTCSHTGPLYQEAHEQRDVPATDHATTAAQGSVADGANLDSDSNRHPVAAGEGGGALQNLASGVNDEARLRDTKDPDQGRVGHDANADRPEQAHRLGEDAPARHAGFQRRIRELHEHAHGSRGQHDPPEGAQDGASADPWRRARLRLVKLGCGEYSRTLPRG